MLKSGTRRALALLVLFAACHDGTAPGGTHAPLSIVSGNNLSDTVAAKLSQPLVVEVRGSDGQLLSGVQVRFLPIVPENVPLPIQVARAEPDWRTALYDTTDDQGRAAVQVWLGSFLGQEKIVIDVPSLGLQDTARYTALTAAVYKISVGVRDTMVAPGTQYALAATAADRFGNPRPDDKVIYTSRSAVTTVDVTGKVNAAQEGRGTILLQSGRVTDSAQVSIVPLWTLAVFGPPRLFIQNTDGSQNKVLTTSTDTYVSPQWSPDGTRILIYEGNPSSGARLSTVDMNGARTLVVGPSSSLAGASAGRFTRDGSWIYFTGYFPNVSVPMTYRVKPDGTQLEQVGPLSTEGGSTHADISPDGATELFESFAGVIGTMNIATHTITSLGVTGRFPRYSPDGGRIAYVARGQTNAEQLFVMNADGTDQRAVSPPNVSYWDDAGLEWSPDGQFLIASFYGRLDMVRVTDGLRLPMTLHDVGPLQAAFRR